ncbi:MAG: hypothetical protein P9L92_02380 [Candidatus Electryonea clarkiae]|nr:hypothetical protein [Candidatus Electryonea clarkiae]MDP8288419.1 hypothetical protein [Candidatus Electryonea clarkiae]
MHSFYPSKRQRKGVDFYVILLICAITLCFIHANPLQAAITETGVQAIPPACTAEYTIVHGDIAYMPSDEGMFTIDISDPTAPDTIQYMDAAVAGWSSSHLIDGWMYVT